MSQKINLAETASHVVRVADALDASAHASNTGVRLAMEDAARKGRDFALACDRVIRLMPKPKDKP